MIQQETRLKLPTTLVQKKSFVFVLWAALQEDMQTSVTQSLLRLKMQHQAALLKKVRC
mgnify:CR=1 FL=1